VTKYFTSNSIRGIRLIQRTSECSPLIQLSTYFYNFLFIPFCLTSMRLRSCVYRTVLLTTAVHQNTTGVWWSSHLSRVNFNSRCRRAGRLDNTTLIDCYPRPFSKTFFKEVITCKVKHLQNICNNILESSTPRSYAVDVKVFYFTCNHL